MFDFGTTNTIRISGAISSDIKASKFGPKDTPKAEFRISHQLYRKNVEKDKLPWQTYFVSVTGYDAEKVTKYAKRGRDVTVEGTLEVSFKADKDGNPSGFLNVACEKIRLGREAPAAAGSKAPAKPKAPEGGGDGDGFNDDDLPF